jgi:hypothetical protein
MRRTVIALTFLLLGAAHAAPVEKPAEKPPPALDLIHQVERLAAGKPLPIVVVADDVTRQEKPTPQTGREDLLGALQDIGEAFSDAPEPPGTPDVVRDRGERNRTVYQPFAFGSGDARVWTIASDTSWAGKPAPAASQPMIPYVAGRAFLHSLRKDQLVRGTTAGLRWADYTEQQQALLRSWSSRPWAVMRMVPEKGRRRARTEEVISSTEPLPIEKCVLRLYLGFTYLEMPGEKPGSTDSYRLFPDDHILRMKATDMDWLSERTPVYNRTLKPSDLALGAPALRKPIGLAGITTVGDLVKAATVASGLPLRVDARFGALAAFAGDAAMPAGDALRLLTFGLDGAWRKVGGVYLLTWDRMGLAEWTLAQRHRDWSENGRNVQYAEWEEASKSLEAPDWLGTLRSTLKPDPQAPVGPTQEQFAAVIAPLADAEKDSNPYPYMAMRERERDVYRFSHLDTSQQESVRDIFRDRRAKGSDAPFPMARLGESRLVRPDFRAILDIPGTGPVNIGDEIGSITYTVEEMMRFEVADSERDKAAEEARQSALLARPLAFAHPVRAVAAPPLLPGEWTRLFDQMKRKGLNTLYVPALWDGMTLFPSDHFPQAPICKGADTLAQVLEQAKRRNVRVIAVVHALAWRLPESEVHWLAKRPDLVDVDAMGRTRRAWRQGVHPRDPVLYGDSGDRLRRDPSMAADLVRPAALEVRTRLLGLLTELRRYNDLSGVALADWSRSTAPVPDANPFGGDDAAPSLGYDLADRSAFLAAEGVDPLDIAYAIGEGDDGDPALPLSGYGDKWNAFRHAQDLRLASALIAGIKETWPDRAQLFDFLEPAEALTLPSADVTIVWKPFDGITGSQYRRVSLPSAPTPRDYDSVAPPPTPAEQRKQRLDEFDRALHEAAPSARATGVFKADGVVFDFTASPDLMWEGLKLLPSVGP